MSNRLVPDLERTGVFTPRAARHHVYLWSPRRVAHYHSSTASRAGRSRRELLRVCRHIIHPSKRERKCIIVSTSKRLSVRAKDQTSRSSTAVHTWIDSRVRRV